MMLIFVGQLCHKDERCLQACGGRLPRTTEVGRLPGGQSVVDGSKMVCVKYV